MEKTPASRPPRRVAIVHEWFTSMRGGEKCVEALCEVFPDATVFALLHVPGTVSPVIERMPIRTSFIQHLPFAAKKYRHYLPLFPAAVERFDMREFDLVISSNHCVAKGVRVAPHALHICYCYTPMRYIWGLYDDYFSKDRAGLLTRIGMRLAVGFLRRWDVRTAKGPRAFIAISENIRERIREIYGRDSDVIYPPVDTAAFHLSTIDDGFFLIVSALVPYKRIDLAITACNATGDPLTIIGDGPDLPRLKSLAGPTITFSGWQSDAVVRDHFARCSAVLFPGEEDFGIVPVEAMACGKPVIAFARGGALETVIDRPDVKTGVLFAEQTTEALVDALKKFRETRFEPSRMREWALGFDRDIYKGTMERYIMAKWAEFQGGNPSNSYPERV